MLSLLNDAQEKVSQSNRSVGMLRMARAISRADLERASDRKGQEYLEGTPGMRLRDSCADANS